MSILSPEGRRKLFKYIVSFKMQWINYSGLGQMIAVVRVIKLAPTKPLYRPFHIYVIRTNKLRQDKTINSMGIR